MTPPTEEPLKHFALLACFECDEQPVRSFLFACDVVRAGFVYPACNVLVEQGAYYGASLLIWAWFFHLEVTGAMECLGGQCQIIYAVQARIADTLTYMAVGG